MPRGKSQKTLMKDWMKITIEVHRCLDALEKLRNEKRRLLKLAEENPSMDVTKRMKVNLEQYEDLLNKTAELNAQAKALKEKIGDTQ